jgi:hypothetical protein
MLVYEVSICLTCSSYRDIAYGLALSNQTVVLQEIQKLARIRVALGLENLLGFGYADILELHRGSEHL